MKKSYLMLAAAAALFAACSSNDLAEEKSPQITQPTVDEQAVAFDAYTSRGTTRAGYSGDLTTDKLKNPAPGFGVFGYYTDGERYAGNTKPNFFYNQKVYWQTSPTAGWVYSPIKYWPNEFGNDAISDQVDRLTLFAYAPWVEVDPLTGIAKPETKANPTPAEVNAKDPTTNITGMTRNNATGDPFVKYTATMDPTNTVDLCWGVAQENFVSSNSTTFPNNIKKGEPYIDVTKPGLEGKIKFDFKHALTKLNVQVDYDLNADSHDETNELEAFTKIWVRSVTFEGITMKGALNLREGEWYQIDASGDNKITSGTVTVYDGLKDGKEPIGTAANEIPSSLNPALIQSKPYDKDNLATKLQTTDNANVYGVKHTPQNLFKPVSALTDPVYVIPTGEKMKVTIVYDVETYDKNLAYYLSDGVTPGSTVQNTITKTIDSFGEIQAGKWYVLKLHLGMRSVDFEAEVHGWDETIGANTDLPSNLPSFAAGGGNTYNVTLPAGAASFTYDFALTGLKKNEVISSVSKESDAGTMISSPTTNDADASGIAKEQVTVAQNKTTSNKTAQYRWTAPTTGGTVLKFTQLAHTLDFSALSYASKVFTCTISSDLSSDVPNMTAINTAGYVKVYRNDVLLTSPTDYTLASDAYTISLVNTPVANDVFKIELQAHDAPVESRTISIVTP